MDSVTYSQTSVNTAALEADIFTVFDLMAGQLISHSEAHARLRSLYASLRLVSRVVKVVDPCSDDIPVETGFYRKASNEPVDPALTPLWNKKGN